MELEIHWTEFAESEIERIFEYYKEEASYKIAKDLVDEIFDETLKLSKHPEIGQVESFLEGRSQKFRYLVYRNYKIIYWINNQKNRIEISDVFDTHQNPPKIKRIK